MFEKSGATVFGNQHRPQGDLIILDPEAGRLVIYWHHASDARMPGKKEPLALVTPTPTILPQVLYTVF
jgi:hypothetical protein